MTFYTGLYKSPFGPLSIVVNQRQALTHILFLAEDEEGQNERISDALGPGTDWRQSNHQTAFVRQQLESYFSTGHYRFRLPLQPRGSAFQQTVWQYLRNIPCGETRTYGQIAAHLGRPRAARAVGRANATNPIPIVIPCHRVIGANGSLTGFAGGINFKRRLLRLEGAANV